MLYKCVRLVPMFLCVVDSANLSRFIGIFIVLFSDLS